MEVKAGILEADLGMTFNLQYLVMESSLYDTKGRLCVFEVCTQDHPVMVFRRHHIKDRLVMVFGR